MSGGDLGSDFNPRISVVIPVYNCAKYVSEAIDSVLGQTYKAHELIVVDDGSTDGLQFVLKKYSSDISYVRQENAGAASARNLGIGLASGEWIAFLDSDDIWLPHKLERQVSMLYEFQDIDVVYSQVQNFGDDIVGAIWPTLISEVPNQKELLCHWASLNHTPPTPTVVVRRKSLEDAGFFSTHLRTAEDLDLWVRLLVDNKFLGLKEVLVLRRVRGDSLTNLNSSISQYDRYLNIIKYRRCYIKRWSHVSYISSFCYIHSLKANCYYLDKDRLMCAYHSLLGSLASHTRRNFSFKLFVESLLGQRVYEYVSRLVRFMWGGKDA